MFYEVVLDASETSNKCTIAPLAHRADFRIMRAKGTRVLGPLQAPILLHPNGACLTLRARDLPAVSGLATIDCVWRRLDTLSRRIQGPLPTLARIPDGFKTAYPRTSLKQTDPDGGLATIEAIFVAAALLGHWDVSLLSQYYFGRKFVEINASVFAALGIQQANDPLMLPLTTPVSKDSRRRRLSRGRPAIRLTV